MTHIKLDAMLMVKATNVVLKKNANTQFVEMHPIRSSKLNPNPYL